MIWNPVKTWLMEMSPGVSNKPPSCPLEAETKQLMHCLMNSSVTLQANYYYYNHYHDALASPHHPSM